MTTNDSLRLAELLKTPICKMDGEELAFLITSVTTGSQKQIQISQPKEEEHIVYGIAGIAQIFGCSIPTASRIKKSGIINDAITQVGRKIIVKADMALDLAKQNKEKVAEMRMAGYDPLSPIVHIPDLNIIVGRIALCLKVVLQLSSDNSLCFFPKPLS